MFSFKAMQDSHNEQQDLKKYCDLAASQCSEERSHIMNGLMICKECGISFDDYIKFGYYNLPLGSIVSVHENGTGRKRIAAAIAKAHHKDPDEIEKQMICAKYKLDLRYPYFKKYEWDLLTEEEKKGMFLRPYSRMLSRKYKTENSNGSVLNNKALFMKTFSDVIGRNWFYFDSEMDFETFKENIQMMRTPYALYKPKVSYGGQGIYRFTYNEGLENLYEIIKMNGGGVVEEFIEQHEDMSRLCPDSVNTIRIVCLYWEEQFKIIYAACRMSSGDGTHVDNVGRGGMAAGVDVATGKIYTYAADDNGNAIKRHPKTDVEIMGFQIPYWDKVVELVEKCSKKAFEVAGLGYVGWDVAITPTGPVMIEGNNWPCPSLIQLCNYVTSRKGMKYLIEDYL